MMTPRHRSAAGFAWLRCLAASRDGATAAEFALVVPVLLLVMFGIIDVGRMLWVTNSLQSAVEDAARCYALKQPSCETAAETQTYAAQAAMGVPVAASAFTASDQTCGKLVVASYQFSSIVPMVPLSMTIGAKTCRPIAPAT